MNFNELIIENEIPDISYQTKERPEIVHPRVIYKDDIPNVYCKKKHVPLLSFLERYASGEQGLWLTGYRKSNGRQTTITFAQKERVSLGSFFLEIIDQLKNSPSILNQTKERNLPPSSPNSKKNNEDGKDSSEKIPSDLSEAFQSVVNGIGDKYKNKPGEDVDAIVKLRVGQKEFRALLGKVHGMACHVSGLDNVRLLIASHIVPWSKSNGEEKTDHNNGLLLAVNWDAVFDKGLISFDHRGKVIFSDELDYEISNLLGLSRKACLRHDLLTPKRIAYLKRHKEEIFERWKKVA